MMGRIARWLSLVALLLILLAGCRQVRSSGEERKEQLESFLYKPGPGPHSVGYVESIALHDSQRGRDVRLRLTYPEGAGKVAVIIFSHYAGGTKDEYQPLISYWVSHGFVCLQPDHLDSRAISGPGVREDMPEALQKWSDRPLDVSFLVDSFGEIERRAPQIKGRLDIEHIGVGGHYLGAHTASLMVGTRMFSPENATHGHDFKDERICAALLLSPTGRGQGLTEQSWADVTAPMMVVTGSMDPSARTGNPPEWRTEPFLFCPAGDKYLVFVQGLSSRYFGLVTGNITEPSLASYISSLTLAFWDCYLKNDKKAFTYLNSGKFAERTGGAVRVTAKH